jgi:diguanylate cyclase (GGDEF)-like protein
MAIWARLRQDFDLAILVLFGACAVLAVTPFACFRLFSGQYLLGLVDLAIVAAICAAIGHAWRSGNTRRAGLFMAVVINIGCLVVTLMFGRHGLMWVYPVIVISFFLASRTVAVVLSLLLLGACAWDARDYVSTLELVSFVVTTVLVVLYTCLFAWRTSTQQARLQILASRDPLTNTGNRRLLEVELDEASAERARRECTLAMLDLDHFKQVNDRHGHEAGDRVLVDFAALVLQTMRRQDRLYRFGGEEFVLLMPGTHIVAAQVLLAKLQSAVRAQLRCPGGPVTVSIGIAEARAGEDWSRWLARADAALYSAKHGGRDRIVVAADEYSSAPGPGRHGRG